MRSSPSFADIEGSPWSAIRQNWTVLTQIAAGVMTVVATVVAPPPTPIGTPRDSAFRQFCGGYPGRNFSPGTKAIQKTSARTLVGRAHSYPLGGDRCRLFLVLQFDRYANRDMA
jgi:hypothetical protein